MPFAYLSINSLPFCNLRLPLIVNVQLSKISITSFLVRDNNTLGIQVFQLKNNVLKDNLILNVQIKYPKFYQLHQGILQLVLLHGAKP